MGKDKRGTAVHAMVKIALGVLVVYSAYCLFLYFFQRHLLFPRFHIEKPSGTQQNIPGLEKMWLNTSHGRVEAWTLGGVVFRCPRRVQRLRGYSLFRSLGERDD